MRPEFPHRLVMVDEVVALFAPVPAGTVVDATVGAGGHATALLDAHPHIELLGIDRDPDAVAAARAALAPYGRRAEVERARFSALGDLMAGRGGRASGVLLDLGVSSPQLDRPERGFSYRSPGPLDMRMDREDSATAAQLVNTMTVDDLGRLFAEHGEARFARRIARAVVAARPLETTSQLADVVAAAIPAAARRRGHPARRVFQALRVRVNEELEELSEALDAALDVLVPGGRCVAIAYHSGEDRLVKSAFARAVTGGCVCPPGLPCTCGAEPLGQLVFRGARRPSPAEVAANRRAESARLRAFERTAPLSAGRDLVAGDHR
jgi:16S rRNA (cytosine1402-N4)-methyltransferase